MDCEFSPLRVWTLDGTMCVNTCVALGSNNNLGPASPCWTNNLSLFGSLLRPVAIVLHMKWVVTDSEDIAGGGIDHVILRLWSCPMVESVHVLSKRQIVHFFVFRQELFDPNSLVEPKILINICYAVTLSLYIYLEIAGFWQTGPEIANFYMFIWAYVSRVTMVGEVSSPFCKADRELF